MNQRGTWKNDDIDVSFTSPDFANFIGGENPNFSYILTSLHGTCQVNGMTLGGIAFGRRRLKAAA